MDVQAIGRNIETILKARHMTQAELSRRTGIAQGTIKNHIDSGRMGTEYLVKYAEGLGCTIQDLVDGAVDPENFKMDTDITAWYPWNLAMAVADGNGNYWYLSDEAKAERKQEVLDRMYKIYIPALLKSISELSDREQKVLKLRFENGLNLEQTGYRFGVTRERIRQVEAKAIRKLRHPRHFKNWQFDTIGKAWEVAEERDRYKLENIGLKEKISSIMKSLGVKESDIEKPEESEKETDVDIQEMELSVRSYNCLKRARIDNISDLEGMTVEKLMMVRNLGKRSVDEVISKAREWGIEIEHEC